MTAAPPRARLGRSHPHETRKTHLEDANRTPGDVVTFDTLELLDVEHICSLWAKAVARRESDPDGAITLARTLLEAVTKHILDDLSIDYTITTTMKSCRNYTARLRALTLAPSQHSEEPIKAILGGIMNLVNGIGTLRIDCLILTAGVGDCPFVRHHGTRPCSERCWFGCSFSSRNAPR